MTVARDIPEREALKYEFKSDRKRLPDGELIDTVVALANTEGGTICLGVEDDGTPTGIYQDHAGTTKLAALVANKTVPPVPARVSTLLLNANGVMDEDGV